METTKTILEWLNEIEEPEIREAAVRYAKENYKDSPIELDISDDEKLSEALNAAFVFSKTTEGFDYWENYYQNLISQGK